MSQIENVEAINRFFQSEHPHNDKSANIKKLFTDWYQNSSWYDKNLSTVWYDEMLTRKNQYTLANANTPHDLEVAKRIMTTGMTEETMQGKERKPVDVKTGAVGSQIKNPTIPGIAPGLSRNLKKGVTGNDVKQWQSFLGLTPPTGYFDALTDSKTRDWQKSRGLKVDGIVGKNSWTDAFGVHAVVTTELPKPAQQTPAAAKNTPAPANTPAANTPAVLEASLIPNIPGLEKLPLWAKIAGALGIGGVVAYAAKKQYDRT
jgi:peptidoglycan hydrolase-like protein with peptidoglycan-binding domain